MGCALAAASAATGFRSWLQNHTFGWLTARRLKALTIGAICSAALLSSVGFSGSSRASGTGSPGPHAGQASPR